MSSGKDDVYVLVTMVVRSSEDDRGVLLRMVGVQLRMVGVFW